MRCTANPGGVGGWWVKKMYIDSRTENDAFPAYDIDTMKPFVWPNGHEKAGQPLFYRKFVPARLTDNPHLMADGQYEAMLRSLPEVERKRLLEGDWDVAEGAAFPEFSRARHVVEHFDDSHELAPHTSRRLRLCRVRRAFYGVLLTGIIIFGFIVSYMQNT